MNNLNRGIQTHFSFFVVSAGLFLYSFVFTQSFGEERPGLHEGKVVQESAVTDGIEISVAAPVTTAPAHALYVRITIKNLENDVVSYVNTSADTDYAIAVLYENGDPVPLTAYGKQTAGRKAGGGEARRIVVNLKQGDENTDQLLLNRLYDMSTAGVYVLSISRNVAVQAGVVRLEVSDIKIGVGDMAAVPDADRDPSGPDTD